MNKILLITGLITALSLSQENVEAQDWYAGGSSASSYAMSGDPTVAHESNGGVYIQSIEENITGTGTWMTNFETGVYKGHSIKLSAFLRTRDVSYAALWVRVEADGVTLSSDDMPARYITGTRNWEQHEIILDVPENATDIYLGIILGGSGEVWADGLVLESGNLTWERTNTGLGSFLLSLDATDENHIWGAGVSGTFIRSADGGSEWEYGIIPGAESLDMYSIVAIDADVAYVTGSNWNISDTRIYKTTDGGENWELQYQNTGEGAFINSIAFWDADHGIAACDPVDGVFVIITTEDGGASWNQVPGENLPVPYPGEFAGFADGGGRCLTVMGENHVWFGTAYGQPTGDPVRVLRSTDGGQHWEEAETELYNGGNFQGISAVHFIDTLNGFAGGSHFPFKQDVTCLVRTTDGGKTWTPVEVIPASAIGTLLSLPGSDPARLLATSAQGTLYSYDGGESWVRLNTEPIFALTLIGGDMPLASGSEDGFVYSFNNENFTVSVENEVSQQTGNILVQNFPNPFHDFTTIRYSIRRPAEVRFRIYNMNGQLLETLFDDFRSEGAYEITWEPMNLPPGIYYYSIETDQERGTGKMVRY